jgi:hypothetical protein
VAGAGIPALSWLRYGQARALFLAVSVNFSLLQNDQTSSGARPTSCLMGTSGSFPKGKVTRVLNLTTHLPLVPRLKLSGIILLNPLYAVII